MRQSGQQERHQRSRNPPYKTGRDKGPRSQRSTRQPLQLACHPLTAKPSALTPEAAGLQARGRGPGVQAAATDEGRRAASSGGDGG